jgi:hypothetical protein
VTRLLFITPIVGAIAGLSGFAWGQQAAPSGTAAPVATAQESASAAGPGIDRSIPDTLMFTIDELNEIRSRMASVGQGADGAQSTSDSIEDATLYLSTIVYSGPQDWIIWVNNVPIGPGQDFQSFKITDIGPRFVELLVPLSAQGMRPVRLEPNQTFVAKSGMVVEGPWR